jgi:branched-chain amino acid transport system permease protein
VSTTEQRRRALGEKASAFRAELGEKASTFRAALGEKASAFRAVLGEKTSAFRAVLGEKTSTFRAALGEKTSTFRAVLGEKASAFRAALGEKASTFRAVLGEKASAFPAVLGEKTSTFRAVLGEKASAFPAVLGEKTSTFRAALGEKVSSFGVVLGEKVSSFGVVLGEKVSTFGVVLGKKVSTFGDVLGGKPSTFGAVLGEKASTSPAVLGTMASAFWAGPSLTAAERRNLLIGVAIFIAAAVMPLLLGGYALQLAISIVMYTALSTSWLLFSGPTNYIALSTAAFFGIGMYTVAGGIDVYPYPLLVAAAGGGSALIAAIVGLATLRVSGVYFVIFSLGLAELIRQIMTWLQHVLGTMSGLYVTIDRSEEAYYWQLLLLTGVIYLIGWWIGRSRLGFALRIIGNDEVVAVHCGINTARAKVILFIISGTFASIVGALVAPRWGYVEPVVAFSPSLSFQVVIMALLGGTHRLWGPLLGVIPFVLLWELISLEFPNQTTLLLGACFLLIVYVIPNGIAGLVEEMWRDPSTGELARGLVKRLLGGSVAIGSLLQRWKDRDA